ncbi:MAG: SRPBCC domain-containing protein [Flavobacteriales bacterium]|nr:SRPBCC domain-containing protein [Flavobacteriales bacterium]MCB9198325.1 SRPBCC domain-containing protein [Flavobacteriales bacterium]
MRAVIETKIEIKATPDEVWKVLMNTSEYKNWNPFVKRLTGELLVGQKIKIQLPGMKFKPVVQEIDTNRKFSWLGKLGVKGLFDGHHQFVLIDEGSYTTFIHKEDFNGLLVKWFMKNKAEETKAGFDAMNIALKNRVESSFLS